VRPSRRASSRIRAASRAETLNVIVGMVLR
jgi:hypothetical protein